MLLELLRQELTESASTLRALQAWVEGQPVDDAEFESVVEFMGRYAEAVQSSGLDALAEYLAMVRSLLSQNHADPNRPERLEERAHLVGWTNAVFLYLERPGDMHAVQAMEYSLSASSDAVDKAWLEDAIDRLLEPDLLTEQSDGMGDAQEEDPQDYFLDVDGVEPDQLQVFLFDAPRQVSEIEAAVDAWGAGVCTKPMMQQAMRAAHTLKGSGYILGLHGIGRLSHHLEDILEYALVKEQEALSPPPAVQDGLIRAVDALQQMLGFVQGVEAPPTDLHLLGQALRGYNVWLVGDQTDPLPELASAVLQRVTAPAAVAAEPSGNAAQQAPLQLESEHLDMLLRRTGQSLSRNENMIALARSADEWFQALVQVNQRLLEDFAELVELVKTQSLQVQESMRARDNFDPLELDRYDAIHNTVLAMEERSRDQQQFLANNSAATRKITNELQESGSALTEQRQDLLRVRALTVKSVAPRLRRTVGQTAGSTGKKVVFTLHGEEVRMDGLVLQKLMEALLHVLRNAVDHGIEPPADRLAAGKSEAGLVDLTFSRNADRVMVHVRDDGRGMDIEKIWYTAIANGLLHADDAVDEDALLRLVLLPGFSTRDSVSTTSGRGVGLDVVQQRLSQLQGDLQIRSTAGYGCEFQISVQANSGSIHALVLRSGGGLFAVGSDQIEGIVSASDAIFSATPEGQTCIEYQNEQIPVFAIADWLELDPLSPRERQVPVILRTQGKLLGLLVDAVLETRELILQGVGRLTRSLGGLSSAALAPDGRAIFLLDVQALQRSHKQSPYRHIADAMLQRARMAPTRLLVVDDAWTVRMTMKQLLEDAGYQVDTAHNGNAALERLRQAVPDLVLTDLEMPEVNGLELARRMREIPAWREIPLVMITSRSASKHQEAAQEAGVQLYLTKPYRDADLLTHIGHMLAAAPKRVQPALARAPAAALL
ncbi:MAG: hybrid sensor histidine kinase/response regulator [Betaproteobacteria bacterium]|nr:hybrid sensor histidine kinase/response regulator [Betaproteobacteria bacterium]